ncbi:hypothetical protein GQR58_011601 [Nymphon striatum]|nr:hypothetical protein GQR58_011601 [Nymphon striatum]
MPKDLTCQHWKCQRSGTHNFNQTTINLERKIPWYEKLPLNAIRVPISDPHKDPDLEVFTDGSKTNHKVGAGLCIFKPTVEGHMLYKQQIKLGPHCTNFQAELLAIQAATDYLVEYKQNLRHTFNIVNIYSDARNRLLLESRTLTVTPL